MATLDGKEVPQCVRCTAFKPDAKERTITKDTVEVPTGETKQVESKSVLCDECAAKTAEVYEVKPLGRASATAKKDEEGPTAVDTSSTRGKK